MCNLSNPCSVLQHHLSLLTSETSQQRLIRMPIELKQTAVCGICYTDKEFVSLRAEAHSRNLSEHVNLLAPTQSMQAFGQLQQQMSQVVGDSSSCIQLPWIRPSKARKRPLTVACKQQSGAGQSKPIFSQHADVCVD